MKALLLKGPGDAVVADVPEPASPGNDEILLKVRKVGLCGSDLNSYRGRNPLVTYPRILGHEVAATVAELNSRHPEWQPGTEVAASPLYELRQLCLLLAWPPECLPVQPDTGRAARWSAD